MAKNKKKAETPATSRPKPSKPSGATIINFPSIVSPLTPTSTLLSRAPPSLITILESQILVIPQLLSVATCRAFTSYFATLPLVPSPPAGRDEATRTNFRLSVEDPTFAARLFKDTCLADVTGSWTVKLGKRVLQCKGLHSNIRIYRYDEGTFFGPHYDSSTRDPISGGASYWTILVYLTGHEDGVEGGETTFYQRGLKAVSDGKKCDDDDGVIAVAPERGVALLHRHGGSDCLLHEGRPVTKGIKWVLRSDLVFA
jgi:2OG-Fe(II) oxygenase superfamily